MYADIAYFQTIQLENEKSHTYKWDRATDTTHVTKINKFQLNNYEPGKSINK